MRIARQLSLLTTTVLFLVILAIPAQGQTVCSSPSKATSLYCAPLLALQQFGVSPSSLGPLHVPVPPAFAAVNADIGTQITQLPTPSPASAVVFAFGPEGLSAQRDLGPIFSERPGTVGKHKLYLGFAYQFFEFDQVNNISLKQIPVQFDACGYTGTPPTPGCSPSVQTQTRLDIKMHEFTSYLTLGVTSRVDLSLAVPILDVRMQNAASCNVCTQTQAQTPTQAQPYTVFFNTSQSSRSAAGIGDLLFRVKAAVINGEKMGFAVGADARAPTGDQYNFQGSGAAGIRPFAALDYRTKFITPHANVGFQVNGDSGLASYAVSTTKTVTSAQLPNSFTYSAGLDLGITRTFEGTVDLLGQTFFHVQKAFQGLRQPLNTPDTACQPGTNPFVCSYETLNTDALSAGAKYNPVHNLIISASILVKLDQNGLHYKPSPMIGISYKF